MNNCLFNIFYSSNNTYRNKSSFLFIVLQIIKNFHLLIIIDIIFNRESILKKHIYFPLYFLNPILYLEYLLTHSNTKCLLNPEHNSNILLSNNDQLSIIISFAFNANHSVICKNDSYIYIIGAINICILFLFFINIFLPCTKNKSENIISQIIHAILLIFYKPFLHILFYLSTKNFIFHSPEIGEDLDIYSVIWVTFILIILIPAIIFNSFSIKNQCLLNFIIQEGYSDVIMNLLSAIIINLRMVKVKYYSIILIWGIFFLKKVQNMCIDLNLSKQFTLEEKIDVYMYLFYFCLVITKLISSIIIFFDGKTIGDNNKLILDILEIIFGVILYILYIIILHFHFKRKITAKQLLSNLLNDNQWNSFQNQYIIFNQKFFDFFNFRFINEPKLKDREYSLEVQKRKSEIVNWFRKDYITEIRVSDIGFQSPSESSTNINMWNSSETTSLLQSLDNNIKRISSSNNKLAIKTNSKNQLSNSNNSNGSIIDLEFKNIFDVLIKFNKAIKHHVNNTFWNSSQKRDLNEFLLFTKLIYFVEYDNCTTRAEFYVKKYLSNKNSSEKFKILMHFFDLKFKQYALSNEENLIHTIMMIQLSEKLLNLISLFRNILDQIDLHGDTEQKRLEIMERENNSIGKCYKEILNYSQMNENKYKLNENSMYSKLKIAQTILFTGESPNKIIEEADIQLAENEFLKNNYFILNFEKDSIIIHKSPAKYLEISEFKGDELEKKDFSIIIPKCFRKSSIANLRKKITKCGEFKFEMYEFLLTKTNFIIGVKVKYHILPIIGDEVILFGELDLNAKNVINCFIKNTSNEIIEVGIGMNTFFGITPSLLPLSISDIFDTSQPLQDKFLHNRRYDTLDINKTNGIIFNLARYNHIYKHLIKIKGVISEQHKYKENIKSFQEKNEIKDKEYLNIDFVLFKLEKEKNECSSLYQIYEFNFPTLSGLPRNIITSDKTIENNKKDDLMNTCFLNSLEPMQIENKYTVNSASSLSISTNSSSIFTLGVGGHKDKHKKNKKNINIPEILETTYGIVMIIVVIILVIVIKILSNSMVNMFTVIKDIRYLNSLYYNGVFHVLNSIIFEDCSYYNKVVNDIISKNSEIKEIWSEYAKEFRVISSNFFKQYNIFSNGLNKYLDADFILNKVDLNLTMIQNDGTIKNISFLNAINVPKVNFFYISQTEEYMNKLYFFNMSMNYTLQFSLLTETEKLYYVTLLNYQGVLDALMMVRDNINDRFYQKFNEYKMNLFLIFSFAILINLLSFFLYVFNINMTKKQILDVSKGFFELKKKNIVFLNQKLNYIKKLIDVEEHPTYLINKMSKETQKKNLEYKMLNKKKTLQDNLPNSEKSTVIATKAINNKSRNLKAYNTVFFEISLSHFLFVIYGCIILPLLTKLINHILIIQEFSTEVASIQKISINYFLTLQTYILLNNTKHVIDSGYVDEYPSPFYHSLKTIQNYMKSAEDLEIIEHYLNSLKGNELCNNLYLGNSSQAMLINICNSLDVLKSSWNNILSHIIRTIRNLFYDFTSSIQSVQEIGKYFHNVEMQRLNIICFCFVQRLMEYVKDTNGILIYEYTISSFVVSVIIMSVVLILLEVGNFIIITGKIVIKLKIMLDNFILIQRFIHG